MEIYCLFDITSNRESTKETENDLCSQSTVSRGNNVKTSGEAIKDSKCIITASIRVFLKSKKAFKETMVVKEVVIAWCVVSSLQLRCAVKRSTKYKASAGALIDVEALDRCRCQDCASWLSNQWDRHEARWHSNETRTTRIGGLEKRGQQGWAEWKYHRKQWRGPTMGEMKVA